MPGLSLTGGDGANPDQCADSLDSLCHFDRYRREPVDSVVDPQIGWTRCPSYPVTTVSGESLTVVLEGRMYNRDLSRGALLELGASVADAVSDFHRREWLRETDGDFVLHVLDEKRHQITIFNDLFGRLPVYYLESEDSYRVSRDIRFLLSGQGHVEFDRVGLAQVLLFGYVLGTRTYWDGVETLPPASPPLNP